MIVIPAIDILDGQCVRLKKGRFDDKTVYFDDPRKAAEHWKHQGAKRLHIVDLDGARKGNTTNAALIADIVQVMGDIPVQVGGGIRSMQGVSTYINAGVSACILGTAAVYHRDFFVEACQTFQGKIIAGLDAKGDKVAVAGWEEESALNLFDCAAWVAQSGACAIVYTDIARDGMLSGVNISMMQKLVNQSPIPVIASGGVATVADIHALMGSGFDKKVFGVISGRALYQHTLTIAEAERAVISHS